MSIPPIGSDVPPTAPYSVDPTGITQDDRTMAMLANLLAIVTGFLGPLIIYLIKKDQSKFVAYHSFQAMIFHIGLNILAFVLGVTVILAVAAPLVWVVGVVFAVIAGMAANRGEWYELPVAGKFTRQQLNI